MLLYINKCLFNIDLSINLKGKIQIQNASLCIEVMNILEKSELPII